MRRLLYRMRMHVLLWVDKKAMRMANRFNALSAWCYCHAFRSALEREDNNKEGDK